MTAVERQMAADAVALSKEHADRADAAEARWAALRATVTTERARRGEAANKAPSYELQNRYWGWTDALDWVLALLDPEAERLAPEDPKDA